MQLDARSPQGSYPTGGAVSPASGRRGPPVLYPTPIEETLLRRRAQADVVPFPSTGNLTSGGSSGSRIGSAVAPKRASTPGSSSMPQLPLLPEPVLKPQPQSPKGGNAQAFKRQSPKLVARVPAELVPQLKGGGWSEAGSGGAIWALQARDLVRSRLSETSKSSEARDAGLRLRLGILEYMESQDVPQGLQALCEALRLRCGNLELATTCLEGGRHLRGRGVSLLEMAGGLALLGLDIPALCGFGDNEVARRLGLRESDGRIAPEGLALQALKDTSGKPPLPPGTDLRLVELWVTITKFVALSAWFTTPLGNRRRGRLGEIGQSREAELLEFRSAERSQMHLGIRESLGLGSSSGQEASVAPGRLDWAKPKAPRYLMMKSKPEASSVQKAFDAENAIHTLRMGILRPKVAMEEHDVANELLGAADALARSGASKTASIASGHPVMLQQHAQDQIRSCWAPCELDLERLEATLRAEYRAHSGVSQLGERLLGRNELFRLIGERPPTDLLTSAGSRHLTWAEVGAIYDDAIELQVYLTGSGKIALKKGLTFESFRFVLLRIALTVGLHFGHLVDDAVDTLDIRRHARRAGGKS